MTTGQGGLVVTDDDALAVTLRQLKDQGRPVVFAGFTLAGLGALALFIRRLYGNR